MEILLKPSMKEIEKGEIKIKFFKVFWDEATNWGFEPILIKYFKEFKYAKKYAEKLVKELENFAKECDDWERIIIVDEKSNFIEVWRAEEGKVVHYPNGW